MTNREWLNTLSDKELFAWMHQERKENDVWIDVRDSLPSCGELVIVTICDDNYDSKTYYTTCGFLTLDNRWIIEGHEERDDITFWQNFPKPRI